MMGCGDSHYESDLCASNPALGTWKNEEDTLVISPNCTGSDSYCESMFQVGSKTFEAKNSDYDFQIGIIVQKTNSQPACPSVGASFCDAKVESSTLHLDCGYGMITYQKEVL